MPPSPSPSSPLPHPLTHAQLHYASVAPSSLPLFFTALASAGSSYVTLHDLLRFVRRHQLHFEPRGRSGEKGEEQYEGGGVYGAATPRHQTEQIVRDMFAEAMDMRAASSTQTHTNSSQQLDAGALVESDLSLALSLRPRMVQSKEGSIASISPRSRFRMEWLRMLLCVVPHPFELMQPHTNAQTKPQKQRRQRQHQSPHHSAQQTADLLVPLPRRGGGGMVHGEAIGRGPLPDPVSTAITLLPQTMYEQEETRKGEQEERARAPALSRTAPLAQSAAASYSFTRPHVSSHPLPTRPRPLSSSSARTHTRPSTMSSSHEMVEGDEYAVGEDASYTTKQRKLKALARAIDQRARVASAHMRRVQEQKQQQHHFHATPLSDAEAAHWLDTLDSSPDSPSIASSFTYAMAPDEHLDAPRLGLVSFATQQQFENQVNMRLMRSNMGETKEQTSPAKQSMTHAGPSEEDEDLLAKSLLAHLTGTSTSFPPSSSSRRPLALGRTQQQPLARSRVRTEKEKILEDLDPRARLADGSVRPRWRNANAPEETPAAAEDAQRSPLRQNASAVGPRRHAMQARLQQDRPGGSLRAHEDHARRQGCDATQARLLADTTSLLLDVQSTLHRQQQQVGADDDEEEEMEEEEASLDMYGHNTYMPSAPNKVLALEQALQWVPHAAGTARNKTTSEREEGKGDISSGSSSPSSPSRARPFHLHFHLPSTQDARLHAARHLSVFTSSRFDGEAAPTIANGGITKLEQLKPGWAPPPLGMAALSRERMRADREDPNPDISLLDPNSHELARILRRQKLSAARPPFRLDFQHVEAPFDAACIARDSGHTSAEEGEKWRLQQLGFDIKPRWEREKEKQQQQPATQTSATWNATGTLNPGETLRKGATLQQTLKGLPMSKLAPSVKKKLQEEQERAEVFQRFPFTPLQLPA